LPGVQCVAIYNRTRAKAESLARQFGVTAIYDDAAQLLDEVPVDFVDIVTDVSTHAALARLAADRGKPVISQKPMATSFAGCEAMVRDCVSRGVPLFVHENWRWQKPIRELKRILDSGAIGAVFRAGIDMISGFTVFQQQPFLRDLAQFILTDLGSHTLDTARFLFGEAQDVTCWTGRVHADIRGEDHATVVMRMGVRPVHVVVRMSYAENFLERECFPQTLFLIEGDRGSIEVAPDYVIRITTRSGTATARHPPDAYPWVDPRYAVVQSSIVACNSNLLCALRGEGPAETTGRDNLQTMRLVSSAYESSRLRQTIALQPLS
jgi:predicted dehydrogenase